MALFINAWLEREDPKIEIRKTTSNNILYKVEGTQLFDLFDSGELSVEDLYSDDCPTKLNTDLLSISIAKPADFNKCSFDSINNLIYYPQTD